MSSMSTTVPASCAEQRTASCDTLTFCPITDPARLSALEREAVQLFDELSAACVPGGWRPSPVVEQYRLVREALLRTPGMLRMFRRSFLAGGKVEFPDAPVPKSYYLQWGRRLPYRGQQAAGALCLLKMIYRLRRQTAIRLADLHDPLIGDPSTYPVPRSWGAWVRLTRRQNLDGVSAYHVTRAQVCHVYYRARIHQRLKPPYGPVLEIGGGYGGLAAELLRSLAIPTYCLVELPDALALAYFYLRGCFDVPIQVLYRPDQQLDSAARLVLVAPWKLPEVQASLDLLINTMSFQHMDRGNLEFYFQQAERLQVKRMYLVNRNTVRDPSDVPIDEYPIPSRLRLVRDGRYPFGFAAHRERIYHEAVSAA